MAERNIRLESTTDSAEQVASALGESAPEIVPDAPPGEESEAALEVAPPATRPDASDDESLDDDLTQEPAAQEPKRPSRRDRRIQQLIDEGRGRDAEIARLTSEIQAVRQTGTPAPDPVAPEPQAPVAPLERYDFDSDEAYIDARIKRETSRQMDERFKAETESRVQESERQQVKQVEDRWWERVAQTRAKTPDWDTVFNTNPATIPLHVGAALQANERGPELLYQLVQDPARLQRMGDMHPMQAAYELGLMASTMDTPAAPAQPGPVRPSQPLPSPPTPVSTNNTGQAAAVPLDEASYKDYKARRNRGET